MKKLLLGAVSAVAGMMSVHAIECNGSTFNPNPGWEDSVSVNGKCYCTSTNFDHDIGTVRPAGFGGLTVREICDKIGPPPAGTQIPYNDIQCGNGPANTALDEQSDCCPGRVDQGDSGCQSKGPKWETAVALGRIVNLRKRNSSGFAIDGNHNGANGQNVYLWAFNSNNDNQKWVEIDRGGGFYSYQKFKTSYSLDGGRDGSNGQNLYLWTTSSSNRNQHWRKVSKGSNNFQLQKRNAQGFSIDGNHNGGNGQNVYLWGSSSNNQNQQWRITEN